MKAVICHANILDTVLPIHTYITGPIHTNKDKDFSMCLCGCSESTVRVR